MRSRSACSGTAETIEAVARGARAASADVPVVLDPVMVAESGAPLLEPEAREALVEAPAARDRRDAEPATRRGAAGLPAAARRTTPEELARAIHALGRRYVVVTGGHGDDGGAGRRTCSSTASASVPIAGPRYDGGAAHGSGCTHSSVLAAQLALGLDPLEAAREAKRIAAEAVRDGLRELGAGAGPVDVLGDSMLRRPERMDIIRPHEVPALDAGQGEVVLAEGDPELSEDEQRLIEEFRRQLDAGMWAAVPIETARPAGARP